MLTGAGEKVFCAGADLGGFAADVPLVDKHYASDLFLEFFRLMPRLGKPSLCAANGHVLAGGMGLALSCDLVIAKEGGDVRDARDQRRRVPLHDHVDHLPQRAAQEGQRDDPARRAAQRRGGRRVRDRQPASSPRTSSSDAVDEWAAKLASKSPVLMRLGHDAMYRQQDMALDDALEYLRSQLIADASRPRTSSRACRRSSKSASRNGRDGDGGDTTKEGPTTRRSTQRRGVRRRRPRPSTARRPG